MELVSLSTFSSSSQSPGCSSSQGSWVFQPMSSTIVVTPLRCRPPTSKTCSPPFLWETLDNVSDVLLLTFLQLNTHATAHRWRRWTRVLKGTSLSSALMAHSTLSRCSDKVSSRKMFRVQTTELTSYTVPHIATTPTSKTRMRPLAITLTVCSLLSAKERSPATSYSTRVHYRAATANSHQTRIRVSTSTSYRQDAKQTQSTSYC